MKSQPRSENPLARSRYRYYRRSTNFEGLAAFSASLLPILQPDGVSRNPAHHAIRSVYQFIDLSGFLDSRRQAITLAAPQPLHWAALVASLFIGIIGGFTVGKKIGFNEAADRRRQLPNGSVLCKPGPWRRSSYTHFTIAAPDDLLPVRSTRPTERTGSLRVTPLTASSRPPIHQTSLRISSTLASIPPCSTSSRTALLIRPLISFSPFRTMRGPSSIKSSPNSRRMNRTFIIFTRALLKSASQAVASPRIPRRSSST